HPSSSVIYTLSLHDALPIFNPMGWTYLTYPFTENNWLPLIFALIFSIIVVTIAFALEGARDMGAGYLLAREGRERAKKSLLSVRDRKSTRLNSSHVSISYAV